MSTENVQSIQNLLQSLQTADYVANENTRLLLIACLFIVKLAVFAGIFFWFIFFTHKIKSWRGVLTGLTSSAVLLIFAQAFSNYLRYGPLASTQPVKETAPLVVQLLTACYLVCSIAVLTLIMSLWKSTIANECSLKPTVNRTSRKFGNWLANLIVACFIVAAAFFLGANTPAFQQNETLEPLASGKPREAIEKTLAAVNVTGIELHQLQSERVDASSSDLSKRAIFTKRMLDIYKIDELKAVTLHESYHLKQYSSKIILPAVFSVLFLIVFGWLWMRTKTYGDVRDDQDRAKVRSSIRERIKRFLLRVRLRCFALLNYFRKIKSQIRGRNQQIPSLERSDEDVTWARTKQTFKPPKLEIMVQFLQQFSRASLLMIVGWVLYLVVFNFLSRQHEAAADRFAVLNTDSVKINRVDVASAFEKLARLNHRSPQPPALYHIIFSDHPSIVERIRAVAEVEAQNSSEEGRSN